MTEASWPLHKAIFDALVADAGLGALVTGVYDHVPAEAVLPYVTLGPASATDWSAGSFNGQDHDITVDVWSAAPGHGEAKQIMAAVHAALHHRDLALEGAQLVLLHYRFSDVFTDADGESIHGVMRFRALTHD